MKRIFTTMLVSMMTFVGVMAQLNIWYNGAVVYQRDYTLIDSITFTIQQPSQYPDLEEGMYIIGEATAVANLNAENSGLALMGAGFNEVVKKKRAGMYEKYIALEANKDFHFILHELGKSDVTYGANLVLSDIETDWQPTQGYRGNLLQNVSMQVPQSGLYHVIVDLNHDGQLNAAQVTVILCEWGIRGGMNGWGYTAMSAPAFNKMQMTYTITNLEVDRPVNFRFAHGYYWKVFVDAAGYVRAETTLGSNAREDGGAYTKIVAGGTTMPIERGMHDITLTWNLNGGETGDCFTFVDNKTADIEPIDYSTYVMELVGAAVAAQQGAVADEVWYWGNRMSMGTPVQNGDVYTWTINAYMIPGEFKVRSSRWEEGGLNAFDNGENLIVETAGNYQITFTLNAVTEIMNVDITPGVPAEPVLVTVKAKLPSDWINTPTAWVWPTGGNGSSATLTQDGDWWVYTTPSAVQSLNIIFRNGNDWSNGQTVDILNLRDNVCYQIQEGTGNREVVVIDCE